MGTTALEKLTVTEKLALLESLCDSLAEQGEELPLSDAQRRLVRERLDEYRRKPSPGTPVATTVDEIRARRK